MRVLPVEAGTGQLGSAGGLLRKCGCFRLRCNAALTRGASLDLRVGPNPGVCTYGAYASPPSSLAMRVRPDSRAPKHDRGGIAVREGGLLKGPTALDRQAPCIPEGIEGGSERRRVVPRATWVAGLGLVCILVSAVPSDAQTVQGRLVEISTGKPVAAAEMSLLSGDSGGTVAGRAVTTDSGRFALTAARPGRYRLEARRMGYRTVVTPPFDLATSQALAVEVQISSQAILLAPLIVVSHRPPLLGSIRLEANGFFDREEEWGAKGLGLGTFIDKGAIERRQPLRVSDLLRTVPGVVVEISSGAQQVVRMMEVTTLRGRCMPMLYLDGQPVRRDSTGDPTIDDLVTPSAVAGIEVYSEISKPGEFTDMGDEPCGAIVIWTDG